MSAGFDVDAIRERFSSLGEEFAFFDAPGGTQVPDEVGEAIARTLREASGNIGAPYETSRRVLEILETTERDAARFLGCDPGEITFGANMSSLNFTLSRTATRELERGDEILVTCLDHDANVAPWLELAHDRGFVVQRVELNSDTTLDLDSLRGLLSERTRIVAFPWASNAIGTKVDAARVCALAHEAGALAWIDAVHYAAHEPIDVRAVDADVLLCSPYKYCGPHLGVAYARAEVSEGWRPYKVRPHGDRPLGRRMETGTQPYELLAGLSATYAYLDSIGGIAEIMAHERRLGERFLAELPDGVSLYGLPGLDGRVPTFLINVDGVPARDVARELAGRGIGVWHHNTWYSLGLYQQLPYEDEAVRLGICHYNTDAEVERLLAGLAELAERGAPPGGAD